MSLLAEKIQQLERDGGKEDVLKKLRDMQEKRIVAEFAHTTGALKNDEVYAAVQNAGDTNSTERMQKRRMTKEEYESLSREYEVNVDTVDYVEHVTLRSEEAKNLPCVLNRTVILRGDGKIDFPTLGFKGMGILSVEGVTDLENGLVQGDHIDKHGKTGIARLSYMMGKRAMQEVEERRKKGESIKLFTAGEAIEKTGQILDILGSTFEEKGDALQALFGRNFSKKWNPDTLCWEDSDYSCVTVSETDADVGVREIMFASNIGADFWADPKDYKAVFTFEDC